MQRAVDITSLNVSVIGAARSGLAAARFLHNKGTAVFLSELASADAYPDAMQILDEEGIAHEFGNHSERIHSADIAVVSPGISSDAAVVRDLERRGIPIISEIELGSMFTDSPIIAVTGTNGKTTTATLIGDIFRAANRHVLLAGNIGLPFTDALRECKEHIDISVLEVSSYQLDNCVTFHPTTAIITTITPDHLSRYHGSFEEYIASKQRVFMNQNVNDRLIYCSDSSVEETAAMPAASQLYPVSVKQRLKRGGWYENGYLVLDISHGCETIIKVDDLCIRGAHNHKNVLMAAIAARLEHIPMEIIRNTLLAFRGVEHRLEIVGEFNGVTWVNDSKATNVDSVVIALKSFKQTVVLIAGGRDKDAPFDPMIEYVEEKVRVMILLGEATERMEKTFLSVTRVIRARDMQEAVKIACAAAQPGDVAMLSPACASFDMYDNFEHRGRVFKDCVYEFCKDVMIQ